MLAAYPKGRTLNELVNDLHPDINPPGPVTNRVRTDITDLRTQLRKATGIEGKSRFITYHDTTGHYRLDPDLIDVDLWRMHHAIDTANRNTDDDIACLAALQQAVDCYQGDFAAHEDGAWVIDHATTYRHQHLSALTRIAEILEPDQPDQAIAVLDRALTADPVNEELYQRIIRIHGRRHRPDEVRRVLRLLENRLAALGETEPTETTRRIANRQLHPTPATR
jgi:two-component SAPR family response regulator